jgi:hypothetical protein
MNIAKRSRRSGLSALGALQFAAGSSRLSKRQTNFGDKVTGLLDDG